MSSVQEVPHLRHSFDGNPEFDPYSPNVYDLSVGSPGPELLKLCTGMMTQATIHRLTEEDREGNYYLFQYGINPGLWECRKELSKFLTRRYGDPVNWDRLVLTCGASHGLHILITTILSTNGVFFVDELTYYNALKIVQHFPSIKIVPVPMINGIPDLDALAKLVKEHSIGRNCLLENGKLYWAMYYTVPIFHNPTGTTLSPDEMKKLIRLARENSLVVVCDDVYNLLNYAPGLPPHRLFYYDDPEDPDYQGGSVISNGTFSKILSPAIRLGWIECGPKVLGVLEYAGIFESGGAVNHYLSGVMASALELGLQDTYIDNMIRTYKERLSSVCEVLDEQLPPDCSYQRPEGGCFVWVELSKDIDTSSLISWCRKTYKLATSPGTMYSYSGEYKNCLRISIAFINSSTVKLATSMLCRAIVEFKRLDDSSKN